MNKDLKEAIVELAKETKDEISNFILELDTDKEKPWGERRDDVLRKETEAMQLFLAGLKK